MNINTYNGFYEGQLVDVDTEAYSIRRGTVVKLGTLEAVVVGRDGVSRDVPYDSMSKSDFYKTSDRKAIKEEEKDGMKFILDKEEKNVDGKMSVRYKVTVDGKEVWTSEEIVTNVYDQEYGWSVPDDFDEGMLEVIKKEAESGFELLVDSFKNIKDMLNPAPAAGAAGAAAPEPQGKPAFAPGSEKGPGPASAPEMTGAEADTMAAGDTGVPAEETEKEKPEIPAEAEKGEPAPTPKEEPMAMAASLEEHPFTRRIAGKEDKRLHGNPQHRINPILRDEMGRKHIDSGDTNDLQLADELKDFNWDKRKGASVEVPESIVRLNAKLTLLNK